MFYQLGRQSHFLFIMSKLYAFCLTTHVLIEGNMIYLGKHKVPFGERGRLSTTMEQMVKLREAWDTVYKTVWNS